MTSYISRRSLLRGMASSAVGIGASRLAPSLMIGFSRPLRATVKDDARYEPAFAQLDDFIGAHLSDMGHPA